MIRKITALLTALVTAAVFMTACAEQGESSVSEVPGISSAADGSSEEVSEETEDVHEGYIYDDTEEFIEVGGSKYLVIPDRPFKMDYLEISWEDLFSYESPYENYKGDIYQSYGDYYSTSTVGAVAAALLYAFENDVEVVDIPVEYGADAIDDAWEYMYLTYPHIPLSRTTNKYERSGEGLFRFRVGSSMRSTVSSSKTLEAAKEIVDSMPEDCKTDAEKAYYLYDWVCQNVGYDNYHADNYMGYVDAGPQSAYGALVNKRAVCDGIAGAVQLLFKVAGLPCSKISGESYEGEGHVWNTAVIDGEVWDLDATWDICRYYNSDTDEVTEEENDLGFYEYFGYCRRCKNMFGSDDNIIYIRLNELSFYCAPPTSEYFSENSPAALIYDYCYNSYGDKAIYAKGGEKLDEDEIIFEKIRETLEENGKAAVALNEAYTYVYFIGQFCDYYQLFDDCLNYDLIKYSNPDLMTIVFEKK